MSQIRRKVTQVGGGGITSRWQMTLNVQLKMIAFSAVSVLLFISLTYLYHNPADAKPVIVSLQQKHSLRVVRMRLQGFQESKMESAHEALRRLPGIAQIILDPTNKKVTVWVDIEQTNLKTIERSLHNAGFTPIYR